jgi:hypothetical protein
MATVKKATRPNEVICFVKVDLNTVKDGKVYMFITMDAYSEFMLQAGVERGDELEYVLEQIQQLLSNTDFNRLSGQPFTLVMNDFEEYRNEIEELIKPDAGTMVIDTAYIKRELGPAIERFLATVAKNHK